MAKKGGQTRRPAEPVAVRIERRTLWRDPRTGRLVKAPRPGQRFPRGLRPRPESRLVQLDQRGRVLRTVELLTRRKVIKTSVHGGPIPSVSRPAHPGSLGSVRDALGFTNVFTKLKGTKRITVIVSGRNVRTRRPVKVQRSVFTSGIKQLDSLLVTSIVGALRQRGLRIQYPLDVVDWSKVRPIKRPWHGVTVNTKSFVRSLTPVTDVDIQVILDK